MKYDVKINKEEGTIALQVEVLPLIPRTEHGVPIDPDKHVRRFNENSAAAYLREKGYALGKVLSGPHLKNLTEETCAGTFVFELQQQVKTTPRKKSTSKVKSKK